MRYPRILAALYGQPWAVLPSTLAAIKAGLDAAIQGVDAPRPVRRREDWEKLLSTSYEFAPDERYSLTPGGTAIIPVSGIIGRHLSEMEMDCGGYNLDWLEHDLAAVGADPAVKQCILMLDTPGGVVTGVPEMAEVIRSLGKPTIGFTDSMAASAAYWLASQCTEVWITPSAGVGSIGVYTAVIDQSAAWAKEGLKLELMKAGKHKAAGIPGLPLADEDKALLQAEVDRVYGEFTGAVSAKRPGVATESMQGQMFYGEQAKAAGLADEIVSSLTAAVAKLEA